MFYNEDLKKMKVKLGDQTLSLMERAEHKAQKRLKDLNMGEI